jgi:hypothetical protein
MANNVLILKSIFLFCSIWGIAILLLWFRSKIELFWKLVATLIFLFYIWFFYNDFSQSFSSFKADWYISILEFIKEIITIIFAGLLIIWPTILIIIFYKASDVGSEKLLKFMCLLTIILWVAFIIYSFFNSGIENFFYETLKKMIPGLG